MNSLTREEVRHYQDTISTMVILVMRQDFDLIRRYLDNTHSLSEGAMDVILPHFMSLREMDEAKRNMTFLREIGVCLLQMRDTIDLHKKEGTPCLQA